MPGTSYTPEQRAEAVEMARLQGAKYAAAECGIPAGTIRKWAQRAGVSLSRARQSALQAGQVVAAMEWELRRQKLANEAGAAAEQYLAIIIAIANTGSWLFMREASAAALVFARLVDKAQLLSGGPTSRTETRETIQGRALEALDTLEAQMRGPSNG